MAPPPPTPPAQTAAATTAPQPYSIVTGANAGIGREIALGLMRRGHHVVLACRRMDACEVAAEGLRREAAETAATTTAATTIATTTTAAAATAAAPSSPPIGTCVCAKLDVSDYGSVRAFARAQRRLLADADAALAPPGGGGPGGATKPALRRPLVLVNNAGVMGPSAPAPPPTPTNASAAAAGANNTNTNANNAQTPPPPPPPPPPEPHLQVNHLGPYLLTRLLMPELRQRKGSRVVFVASRAHYPSPPCPATEGPPRPALGAGAEADGRASWLSRYCRSKLLNVHTAASAHARLAPHGSAAYSVSPGFVATSLFGGLPAWLSAPADAVARLVARTPARGAAVAVFAATDQTAMREALASVDPGASVERRVEQACNDNPWLFIHDDKPLKASAAARDAEQAERVWRVSALITGLEDSEDGEL